MSRQEQLDQMFAKWRTRVPTDVHFIEEGLVDEATWEVAHPRVMVLLKEANSADDGWKYQDFIMDRGYLKERATWPTLVKWVYGLLNRYPTFAEVERNWTAIREQSLDFFKGVYFANVKKIPGGASANDQTVLDFANKHADLLVRQVEIVEPKLVLCCGNVVYESMRSALKKQGEDFEERSTDGGRRFLWWHRLSCRVVRDHHPGASYPREMSYTYLMNEVPKLF
ncbi:hypothetical protein JZ785_10055 [Alicyclobacillus curvatus]|nr:hypothetical protein JZ785_10055 [Alicyclobacillus curvatus]